MTVLAFVAGFIAKGKIEQKIKEQLSALNFHSALVSVNLLARSVKIDSVVYSPPGALPNAHQITFKTITVSGFHILEFLKKKEVHIESVVISDGLVRYNKNLKLKSDTTRSSKKTKDKINKVEIDFISITNLDGALMNDSISESSGIINDLEINKASVSFAADTTFSLGGIELDAEKIKQSKSGALHNFTISKVDYNSSDKHLEVDSFRIFSNYNKTEFARAAKIQKTRLDITLPKTICEGIDLDEFLSDTTLVIERITIPKPVVHAYRDKHYPFVRDWIMPLPIEGIKRLPFKLKIDSILIIQADIAYEEFSVKGLQETGTITFNKLDATFAGLNTAANPDKKAFCTLVADCKVMNSGSLHATFKLPLHPAVNYEAYGNVRNMDLKSLNPHLGNLSRIEIRDGILNDLRFNFSYNDNVSTGEVLINYKSLKLQALKKDKGHEVNKILTAAINAVLKSDKDKTVDKSKRIGNIDIERDKKRFVFQLWWKSVLDGLQSTFLDNGKKKKTRKESSKK